MTFPSPTPTPVCDSIGSMVYMPSDLFHPGDLCEVKVILCNPDQVVYNDVPLFVVLDVFGTYFFAPSFSEFDHLVVNLTPGLLEVQILPPFTWPSGVGSASNILWYAGMTTPEMTELFGTLGIFQFGWAE